MLCSANMACTHLTIQQTDWTRIFQIKDSLKALYDVNLIVNTVNNDANDNNSKNYIDFDYEVIVTVGKSTNSSSSGSGFKKKYAIYRHEDGHDDGQQRIIFPGVSVPTSLREKTSGFPSFTLQFQTEGSQENIETAKNFALVHLTSNQDYIKISHQLSNQLEFDAVLECSREIQTSSKAILTFNRDCLAVTFQGQECNVATARSKVIMVLESLRESGSSDENPYSEIDYLNKGDKLYIDNLILVTDLVKESTNSSSNNLIAEETEKAPLCAFSEESLRERSSVSGTNNSQDEPLVWSKLQSHMQLSQNNTQYQDDIEDDCAQNLNLHAFFASHDAQIDTSDKIDHGNGSSASSICSTDSDDDSNPEENILTDPRYSKQIEQALKLGYNEGHINKALVKLGPECVLNDLLSELIKIGASDTSNTWPSNVAQNLSSGLEREYLESKKLSGKQVWSEKNSREYLLSHSSEYSEFTNDIAHTQYAAIDDSNNLRHIIIDGSNVAMSHGKKIFSCKGIKIAVDWFRDRGHINITAFVPQWRKETSRPDAPISDQDILSDLEKEGIVVFTPARRVKGRRVVCYDDRYILNLAVETDGIVVSNDVYRDLVSEREDFRRVVDQRLLMYSFVNDRFMPPEDPLGRLGPTLDNFLRKTPLEPSPKPQDCPYGKKCTYGNKCRFYHPERGFVPQKSITETLKEQADLKLQERASKMTEIAEKGKRPKQKLVRTKSLFPDESFQSSPSSYSVDSDGLTKKEKPKLSHSKSYVDPTKTSDYLNESRKKLEQAELTAEIEKMLKKDSLPLQLLSKTASTEAFNSFAKTYGSSSLMLSSGQKASPHKDVTKQSNSSLDNIALPPFTSPERAVTAKSPPRTSPTHLMVPKSEGSREGYLSGHLLLAKKLSDESKENNFFSEHTSSPVCSRTSSPVISPKTAEPKHVGQLREISGGVSLPQQSTHSNLTQPQHTYNSHVTYCDVLENLPNLSIFGQEISRCPSEFESAENGLKWEDAETARRCRHSLSSSGNPCSPADDLSSPTEHVSGSLCSKPEYPLRSRIQHYQNCPTTKYEQICPEEHLKLRRAFSSMGNVKIEEISSLKSQQCIPSSHTLGFQASFPHGLTRQNSTSDPQIHNISTGGSGSIDMFSASPNYSTSKTGLEFCEPQSSHLHQDDLRHHLQLSHQQQYQLQHLQQRPNYENQQHQRLQQQHQMQVQRLQQQQHLHQNQQDLQLLNSQLMSKASMGKWMDPSSHPKTTCGRSLQVENTHTQMKPQHTLMSVSGSGHLPHFAHSTSDQSMMAFSSLLSNPPLSSPYHQPLAVYPQYSLNSPTNLAQGPRQVSSYSQHFGMQKSPVYGHMDQLNYHSNPTGPSFHTAPTVRIFPEDMPIMPDDPRYSLYYHLSNVFGEPLVRKVMNLHPDVLNPGDLCNLIMKYKQETGA